MSIVGVGCRATGTDFDHAWFGLDRLAAVGLTPRQRTTLEAAVEALDDSGLGCLATGSQAAVVFGAIGGTNTAHHLSRALDLRGPSLTVDSQRASPLVAVDMGVRLLADESVPFVLAGGVDLTLLPDISDLRLPLPRGAGHEGGDRAGGGAGVCTVLVLQRTGDALRTRTRRYAEIGGPGIGFREARGVDAHIALDDPRRGGSSDSGRGEEPPVLIPVSGSDAVTIHHLALRWAVALGSYRSLREFAAATARLVPEPARAAVIARDGIEAAAQLRALARRIEASTATDRARAPLATPGTGSVTAAPFVTVSGPDVFTPVRERADGGVLLLFPGTGDHPRMGRALAARYPVFAAALTRAVDAVVAVGGPRVWTPRYGFGRNGHVPVTTSANPHPASDHSPPSTATAASSHGADGADAAELDETPCAGDLPDSRTGSGIHGDLRNSGRHDGGVTGIPDGRDGIVSRQISLFVFQYALTALLESWGIHADGVAGHGAGEVAAAVGCGALSLEDGARVAVARARLVARAGGGGAAAVLEATPAEVNQLVTPMSAEVAVAAVDGLAITVSGEPRYVDALVRRAHRRAIFAQRVPAGSDHEPPHLPMVRGRAHELRGELADLTPRQPWWPLYSATRRGAVLRPESPDGSAHDNDTPALRTSPTRTDLGTNPTSKDPRTSPTRTDPRTSPTRTDPNAGQTPAIPSTGLPGDPMGGGPSAAPDPASALRMDGEYWAENVSHAVELAAALDSVVADGFSTVLEVGPTSVLTSAVRERIALRDGVWPVLAADDEAGSLLRTIARLYLEGRTVDWTALGPHTTAPPQRQWRRPDSGDSGSWPRPGFAADGHPPGPVFPEVEIRPEGTYVVAGGLGPQGEAAVRWLLAAGARDVVVLTRTPRPLPARLTGMEDRIVMMRCDCADRADLATALQDIRECGSAVRGVVHASGATRLVAATNLLELTAADPTDFTVLLTSAPGAGGPEAVRELADAQADRRVICVEWEVGPAA
ncbi:acyltransferase domain-containing protein [Nocardia sp. CA-145437]|uniref:acyltransferase domain-containing protein n=1 Tax=Nocardia sp. CA-145437 TaxID=3239980 RepID=UPI003D9730EB